MLRASQNEVLALFRDYGPMLTDEDIAQQYRGQQSPSGLRTRRSELVSQGLIKDSGLRRIGQNGRRLTLWLLV